MKTILAATAIVAITAPLALAEGLTPRERWDRIEDRIDRAESRRDRQVTLGPRDLIEDRIDRWEDRRDRLDKPRPRFVNRWERRSWQRRFN